MASTYKVLGQQNPSATTLTTLYTVPAATNTIVSTIMIANRSGTATAFRISIAVAGAADNDKQYIAYDVPIEGNEAFDFTIGATMAATDVIRVYATLASLSFSAFGSEIT